MGKSFLDALKYIDTDADCLGDDVNSVDTMEQTEQVQSAQSDAVGETEQSEKLPESPSWQIFASLSG